MKKIAMALLVAAGLGAVGVGVAASYADAFAACHDQRSSRYYNGRC